MATMLIRLNVKSGMEARYEEIQKELYAATHREERDVLRYEMWRGQQPRLYYCLLSFKDFRSFILDHQTSPHHEKAAAAFGAVVESLSVEWVDPIVGASELPETRPQALPADAPQVARDHAEAFKVNCPAWWDVLREAKSRE